ncbi:uncharacterized protein LOC124118123 [Haliotis rufescens]|uniref:uncharacterized protein LOC124118123 n=1 Tax=Haliotis rufescens TaxID=6454 RepID=UPI00201E7985|nr:uncharacterized protein LOC124118123 [Haliotis rufescens]
MPTYSITLLSALVLVSLLVSVSAGTVLPQQEPTATYNSTDSIDPYKNHKWECTDHKHCSCVWGVPVCHQYYCYCVITNRLCSSHVDCSTLCNSGIGVCVESACKCYKLVEDRELSDSISPLVAPEDRK